MKHEIRIGNVTIGGNQPIAIQSMCNTRTEDIAATVSQIRQLEEEGCEIVRLAVPTPEAARAIRDIKRQVRIPLVADIHFDHRLALLSIENGIDKVRINPGNIGSSDKVREVVSEAKAAGIPIRIGVNGGSVKRAAGMNREEAMTEALRREVELLEDLDFRNIVLAVKSSHIGETVSVCRKLNQSFPYPMHIGITEAGTWYTGTIKSAVGIGILLHEGIGNTIRVSLSADPVEEIRCAKAILSALDIRRFGVNVIACPTCGRTNVNISDLANRIERELRGEKKALTVAVMGCAVNGPGEAKDADIGVAGGLEDYVLFARGKIIKRLKEEDVIPEMKRLIREIPEKRML